MKKLASIEVLGLVVACVVIELVVLLAWRAIQVCYG